MEVTIREAHGTRSIVTDGSQSRTSRKEDRQPEYEYDCEKTASRRGEEYLEMNPGIGVEIEGDLRHLVL